MKHPLPYRNWCSPALLTVALGQRDIHPQLAAVNEAALQAGEVEARLY